jgi:hypothetical protein
MSDEYNINPELVFEDLVNFISVVVGEWLDLNNKFCSPSARQQVAARVQRHEVPGKQPGIPQVHRRYLTTTGDLP